MNISAITSAAAGNAPTAADLTELPKKDEKLAKVCDQFEGIFMRQILQQGLKPLLAKPPGSSAAGSDVYQYLGIDALASNISGASPIGISNMLQAQLSPKHSGPATPPQQP